MPLGERKVEHRRWTTERRRWGCRRAIERPRGLACCAHGNMDGNIRMEPADKRSPIPVTARALECNRSVRAVVHKFRWLRFASFRVFLPLLPSLLPSPTHLTTHSFSRKTMLLLTLLSLVLIPVASLARPHNRLNRQTHGSRRHNAARATSYTLQTKHQGQNFFE